MLLITGTEESANAVANTLVEFLESRRMSPEGLLRLVDPQALEVSTAFLGWITGTDRVLSLLCLTGCTLSRVVVLRFSPPGAAGHLACWVPHGARQRSPAWDR